MFRSRTPFPSIPVAIGLALALTPGATAQCTSDAECPPGTVCEGGECVRPGIRNPLFHLQYDYEDRRAVWRDDELFWIGAGANPAKGLAFRPTDAFLSPGVLSREALAGASGRIFGPAQEQTAIVYGTGVYGDDKASASSRRLDVLDVLDLDRRGKAGFAAPAVGAWDFDPNPFNPHVAVAVGDLDFLEEDYPSLERHDEVVVAYQRNHRLRFTVLSFEEAQLARGRAFEPTQVDSRDVSPGSIRMPTTGTPSHIAVAIGDWIPDAPGSSLQKEIAVAAYDEVDQTVIVRFFRATVNPDGSRDITAAQAPTGDVDQIVTDRSNSAFGMVGGRLDQITDGTFQQQIVIAHIGGPGERFNARSYALRDFPGGWDWDLPQEAIYEVDTLATVNGTPVQPLSSSRLILSQGSFPNPHTLGEIGDNQLCVMLDTNYGPVMQLIGFSRGSGQPQTGPFYPGQTLVWPTQSVLDARPVETAPTGAQGVAGNFIDYRATKISGPGTNQNRARIMLSDPANGVPLFYLYVFSTGPQYAVDTGPVLDENQQEIHEPMALLLATDVDGDNSYNYLVMNGGERLVYYGLGGRYSMSAIWTPETVLHEPPKHVDYVPDPSDPLYGMLNVSKTEDIFVGYEAEETEGETFEKETQSDFVVSGGESVSKSGEVSTGIAGAGASVHAETTTGFDSLSSSTTGHFSSSESSISLTTVTQTTTDDQLLLERQTFDIWRFPAMGVVSVDDGNNPLPANEQPENPTFEYALPGVPSNVSSGGQTNDFYQPPHINGHILSYPSYDLTNPSAFSFDDVATFQEFRDTDMDGVPDSPTANQPPAGSPLWADEEYTLGSLNQDRELTYTQTSNNGTHMGTSDQYTESSEFTTGGEVSASYGASSGSAAVEQSYSSSNEETFSKSKTSGNFTSDTTKVLFGVKALTSPARGYGVKPIWYFTGTGGMKVAHGVNTDVVNGGTFWNGLYADPDPALDMPYRFESDGNGGWVLNSDPGSFQRMKGLFVMDPSGGQLFLPPSEGEEVVLEARIYNLSKLADVANLRVRFEAQEVVSGGAVPVGPRIEIGEAVVPLIPRHGGVELAGAESGAPNNSTRASVTWDTRGFGPESGASLLRDWRIYVILDPLDEITDETHELEDRFADPLGGLEKGQNNTGWSLVSVGAPDDVSILPSSIAGPDVFLPPGALEVLDPDTDKGATGFAALEVGRRVRVRVRLRADQLDRRVGALTIMEVDADGNRHAIAMRKVWGIDPRRGAEVIVDWTPRKQGRVSLVAEYDEPVNDPRRGNATERMELDVRRR